MFFHIFFRLFLLFVIYSNGGDMIMDIIIKRMEEKEHNMVLDLYERVFDKKQIQPFHISDSNGIFVIAKDNDRVVGLVQLDIIVDVFKGIKYGFINSVCTDAQYRGRGIGDRMIKEVHRIAKKMGCSYIELTSSDSKKAAHRLYFKNGYVIRDTNVFRVSL